MTNAAIDISHSRVAGKELQDFVARIERLEEEKKELSLQISGVFQEMKGRGFDPLAVKEVIRRRKKDAEEREQFEEILDTYMAALGMI